MGHFSRNHHLITLANEKQMGRRAVLAGPIYLALYLIICTVATMWSKHPQVTSILTISTAIASVTRFYISFNQLMFYPRRRNLWNQLFNWTAFWAAANWGILGAYMLRVHGLEASSLTCLLSICGVAAGVSNSLFHRIWLAVTYISIAVLPGIFMELSMGTREGYGMAFVSSVYFIFLVINIRQSHEMHWQSLANKYTAIEQRNKLHAALQGSLDAVVFLEAVRGTDKKITGFVFTEVNKCAESMTHQSKETLIGADLSRLFPDCRTNGVFQKYVAVAETGDPIDEEMQTRDPFGDRTVWLRHQVIAVGDGISVTTRDITDKKNAEQEIRLQQERISRVLKASGICPWEYYPESGTLKCSESLPPVYGLPAMPVDRDSIQAVIHSAYRRRVQEKLSKAIRTHTPYKVEFQVVGLNGTRWIQEIGHPIEKEGDSAFRIDGLSIDITERKETEKVIEEQRLRISESSKLAALGQMAGGIAHEINNPLAAIRSISYLMGNLASLEKLELKRIAEFATQIDGAVDRVAEIIKGLQAFSKDGSLDPLETVSTRQILDEILGFCKTKLERKNVNLILECDPKGVYFECRKTQITQVVWNLLHNALDAVENASKKWIKINVAESESYIHISITDSGPGIPSEIADKIMLPFFTTKEIGKGTGLGLSASKGIIESHCGTFGLDRSSLHTRFVIQLPKRQTSAVLKAA
jgi:signal transduction histidine kinase